MKEPTPPPPIVELAPQLDPSLLQYLGRLWSQLESQVRTRAQRFESLVQLSAHINDALDLHTLVRLIMERSTHLLEAERGAVFLVDDQTGDLEFFVALGPGTSELKSIHLARGEGIAGLVASTGEPVIIHDAASDPRHSKKADQKTGFVTRNVLAQPLVYRDRVIGVLEVLNKLPPGAQFSEEDLHVSEALASLVAVAIENARAWHRAITDRLTGLYNYGYFKERLISALRKARLENSRVALLMLDVDWFKQYNDTHGHLEGNVCLQTVAQVLREQARANHVVARYGGEEFAIILRNTDGAEAIEVAESIRRAVEARDFPGGATQPLGRVTVSIGVSVYPDDADTDDGLLVAADRNLYKAKNDGRNRVVY